ncbi:unnamed protein product [Ostreobium quekettii]|uniref:Uncharacterized protein n=1 Tax=Ostreobium quekettii TaxID=121088 RepID=A0A8S1IXA6_9CHLO|nr:unnamed protein product [Ostreobium quekettii]|eukprot:evm.model.scf_887.3 EVM.evm.TU.scf_887.3   scf_887:16419-19974(+)
MTDVEGGEGWGRPAAGVVRVWPPCLAVGVATKVTVHINLPREATSRALVVNGPSLESGEYFPLRATGGETGASVELTGTEAGIIWLAVVSVNGETPFVSPRVPLLAVPQPCFVEMVAQVNIKLDLLQDMGWGPADAHLFTWNETTWLASDYNFLLQHCPAGARADREGDEGPDVQAFFEKLGELLLYLFSVQSWEMAAFLLRRVHENTGLSLTFSDRPLEASTISGPELKRLSHTLTDGLNAQAGFSRSASLLLPEAPGDGRSDAAGTSTSAIGSPGRCEPLGGASGSRGPGEASPGSTSGDGWDKSAGGWGGEEGRGSGRAGGGRGHWWLSGFGDPVMEQRFAEYFNNRCSSLELVVAIFALYAKIWFCSNCRGGFWAPATALLTPLVYCFSLGGGKLYVHSRELLVTMLFMLLAACCVLSAIWGVLPAYLSQPGQTAPQVLQMILKALVFQVRFPRLLAVCLMDWACTIGCITLYGSQGFSHTDGDHGLDASHLVLTTTLGTLLCMASGFVVEQRARERFMAIDRKNA